ncbi:phage tail assembly chaperone [Salmonella enterica]
MSDVSDDIKNKFRPYREALRNLPEQAGFPFDIEWPVRP